MTRRPGEPRASGAALPRPRGSRALLVLLFLCAGVGTRVESQSFTIDPGCSVHLGILAWAAHGDSLMWGVAAQMAVLDILTQSQDLVSFPSNVVLCKNITYELRDTLGSAPMGVQAALTWGSSVDAIVGSYRSAVSGPTSLAAQVYDVPVLSFGSTAASLSDKDSYPALSRTIPPDAVSARVMASMCAQFNFTRVGIIYISDAWGSGYATDFITAGSQLGIEVVASIKFSSGDRAGIRVAAASINEAGLRVIIVMTFTGDIHSVLEAARELGMTNAKGYSWITPDGIVEPEPIAAAAAEPALVREELAGWINILAHPLSGGRGTTFADKGSSFLSANTSNVFGTAHSDILAGFSQFDPFSAFMYDAVWLAALATSSAKSAMAAPLADGGVKTVQSEMRRIAFSGVSGSVDLLENGDRSGEGLTYAVVNWKPNKSTGKLDPIMIGIWESEAGFIWITDPRWPGNKVEGWEEIPVGIALCDPGSYFDADLKLCTKCPVGTRSQGVQCIPCEVGKIASEEGMVQCITCKTGYADQEGMHACRDCPERTEILPGSPARSADDCKCLPDAYNPSIVRMNATALGRGTVNTTGGEGGNDTRSGQVLVALESECKRCPAGATCPGGLAPPYPKAGHWGDAACKQHGGDEDCDEWDVFYPCFPEEACVGGAKFECGEGREGRMCTSIKGGWFNVGATFFFSCNGTSGVIGTAFAIMATLLAWLGMNTIASSNYEALDIALLFLQITGMISAFTLRWHPNLATLNTILTLVNFEVDFVSPCPIALNAYVLFYTQLVLPLIFSFCYFIYYATKIVLVEGFDELHTWRAFLQRVLKQMGPDVVSIFIVGYHQISQKSFGALACQKFPNGRSYLRMAPTIECWVGYHWIMVVVAVVYLVVVVLGLPAFVFYYTRQQRWQNRLEQGVLDFLYERYEVDWIWWHSVLIVRRMMIAFILMCIEQPMIQGGMATVVLAGFIVLHSHAKPFINEEIDMLEMTTLIGSLMYCLAGLMFFPSLSRQSQGFVCPADGEEVCEIDNWSKLNLSYLVLIMFCIVIAVCIAVTFANVLNVSRERKAVSRVREFLKAGGQASNSSQNLFVDQPDKPKAHSLVAALSTSGDTDTEDALTSPSRSSSTAKPWSRINKVVRGSSFAVVQLKNVDIAEGDNARLFEGVISAGVLARWARWVSEESTAAFHTRKKKEAAKAFVGVRSKFNNIESVSEHTVTTIAQVVRNFSQVEGVLDWVIERSTQDERILLTEIFKGLAEFHDEMLQTDRYENLIRPAWRPTMLWFALRSNADRVDELKTLLDSMIKHGKANVLVLSTKVADGGPDEPEEEAGEAPGKNLGILNIIALAEQKRKANAKFAQPSVFKETSAAEIPEPSKPEAGAVFAHTLMRATSGNNLSANFPALPDESLLSPGQSIDRAGSEDRGRGIVGNEGSVFGVASVASSRLYGSSRRTAGVDSNGRGRSAGVDSSGRGARTAVRNSAGEGAQHPALYSFSNAVAAAELGPDGELKDISSLHSSIVAAGATLHEGDESEDDLAKDHAS